MLWKPSSYPVNPTGASLPSPEAPRPPRKITGRKLACLLKKARTPQERLRLACELTAANIFVVDLTLTLAARLVRFSPAYVNFYNELTESERAAFDRGEVSIAELRKRRADKRKADRIPTDAELKDVLQRAGLTHAWRIWEELTSPSNGKVDVVHAPDTTVTNGAKALNGNGHL